MALLDDTANADVAWSVRLLRDAYAGACLRVRRSSDDLEQDIGFDGSGRLDTASLLSFVGAGDGFVVTWYDQTGNGRDLTELVVADQPQIVAAGSVLTQGDANRPAIFGDGAGDRLRAITTMPSTGDTAFSVFSVHNQITAENFTGMVSLQPGTIDSDRRFIAITRELGNTKAVRLIGGNTVYTEIVTVHHRWASIYSSGGGVIPSWVDGSSLTVDSFNNSGLNIRSDSAFCLFMGDASGGMAGTYSEPGIVEGYVQEVLWYLSDQTANREAIDESQLEYFVDSGNRRRRLIIAAGG